jgi:Family of unknown function (DUF6308)
MRANDQVVLRDAVVIEKPVTLALRFLEAYSSYDLVDRSEPTSFKEPDLRLANRGGARISAAESAAILERRRAIERALRAIAPDTSLTAATRSLPWAPLERLFAAFGDLRGVGFSKMTKALHPKRPALIPILDSVIQAYLKDDDLGGATPFGERALGFVRGYKRDLDRNRPALRTARNELARYGYRLTEVRLLDILIWSVTTAP